MATTSAPSGPSWREGVPLWMGQAIFCGAVGLTTGWWLLASRRARRKGRNQQPITVRW